MFRVHFIVVDCCRDGAEMGRCSRLKRRVGTARQSILLLVRAIPSRLQLRRACFRALTQRGMRRVRRVMARTGRLKNGRRGATRAVTVIYSKLLVTLPFKTCFFRVVVVKAGVVKLTGSSIRLNLNIRRIRWVNLVLQTCIMVGIPVSTSWVARVILRPIALLSAIIRTVRVEVRPMALRAEATSVLVTSIGTPWVPIVSKK